jgi:cytochrome c554/c'-like protein
MAYSSGVDPARRRRYPRIIPALGLIAILGLSSGCVRRESLSYDVAVAPDDPAVAVVTARIDGAPKDSLTLLGRASVEILGPTAVEAFGEHGERLPARVGVDSASADGEPIALPKVILQGPIPGTVTLRYRVRPGHREGDEHVGFTGRCFGHLGRDFGLVTGRGLFLLPEGAESIQRISVHFTLPPGWTAIAPWSRRSDAWWTDVNGQDAAEHLISATVGLGRFHDHSIRIAGTTYRFAFESRLPKGQEDLALARLGRAARYLHARFGRDLGTSYVTIAVPESRDGDEILGESWGTGQGQTLVPLSAWRLRGFASRLVEAYVRDAPYRTEIRKPDEFWLVDAITHWYAWRGVAAAGMAREDDLNRSLAVSYIGSLNASGSERNLENLYTTSKDSRLGREVLAPFVLAHLDHVLRAARDAPSGFDGVLRRMFDGREAPSLWAILPRREQATWQRFRENYVRGGVVLPVAEYFPFAPTRPMPEPPRGRPARHLTLAYTGDSFGFLENCGCKVNQSGGVARRETVLRALRQGGAPVVVLDAGSAFTKPEKQTKPDFFSTEEQKLYLGLMDSMGYRAAAVGATELAFGVGYFHDTTRGMRTPYLGANIQSAGRPVAPGTTVVSIANTRVGVVGIFEPPVGDEADPRIDARLATLTIEDPVAVLSRLVPVLRPEADLVVVLGRLTPATIRRVARDVPDIDVVISTEGNAPRFRDRPGRVELDPEDASGFLGRTLVLYTPLQHYGFESAKLGLDASGRIASASIERHLLDHTVRDDPGVRRRLDRFYDAIGKTPEAQASVKPLFAGDSLRMEGTYAGAARCAGCHEEEYAQWKTTQHAAAYKTLLDAHRHYQPRCVACHVVGYGTRSGYRIGMGEEPLGNVQCEVCHGPGGAHVADPDRAHLQKEVPERICLECHNPDHSDHFVYAERLPRVRHD